MDTVLRHHADQKLLAANIVGELRPLWGILQFHDLQGTTRDWLKAVRPIVERGYLSSQFVAAQFYTEYRSEQLPESQPLDWNIPNPFGALGIPVEADSRTGVRIMVSMRVTGPIWVANQSHPGITEQQAVEVMEAGFSKSSGAAIRLVLNGGRGMVKLMADADPEALGVIGVADEGACNSCSFLASQPLLKATHTEAQMRAVAVGHDFCSCSSKPVFS